MSSPLVRSSRSTPTSRAAVASHQGLVGGVVAGDVVAGGGGPVRALDQEAEEGLLLRREEHHQRGAVPGDEPGGAVRGVGPEREFDPLAGVPEVIQRAVPDEPVLGAGGPLVLAAAAAG